MRKSFALIVMVAVVSASLGGIAVAADDFSDVPDSHPFHDDISWLAASGVTEGFADGTYRPTQPVTRQAMAAFMRRLAGQDPDVDPVVDAAQLGGRTPADYDNAVTLNGRTPADYDNAVTLNGRTPADYDNAVTLNGETNEDLEPQGFSTVSGSNIVIPNATPVPIANLIDRPAGRYLVLVSGRVSTTNDATGISCRINGAIVESMRSLSLGGAVTGRVSSAGLSVSLIVTLPLTDDIALTCLRDSPSVGAGDLQLENATLTAVELEDL